MTGRPESISLSVIVPCYNVEPYLDGSLKCLERQWGARTDYEIILVNDASRDATINRLNNFRSRYPDNVIVIDKQQNEGVSAARNSGLDIARGEWITFFDPDDMLAEDGYERLLSLAEGGDFDILRFGVKIVADGEDVPSPDSAEPLNIDWRGTSVEYMLDNSFGTCWSYLFRHDLLTDRRFPPLSICEDTVFNLSILLQNKAMARAAGTVYYYMIHPSSATTTVDSNRLSRHCDDIFEAINILEGFKDGQNDAVKQRITKHQWVFSPNLLTRLLLSSRRISDIKEKVEGLKKISLFPLRGGGVMSMLMNTVFKHPWLVPLFRPVYRLHRNRT